MDIVKFIHIFSRVLRYSTNDYLHNSFCTVNIDMSLESCCDGGMTYLFIYWSIGIYLYIWVFYTIIDIAWFIDNFDRVLRYSTGVYLHN